MTAEIDKAVGILTEMTEKSPGTLYMGIYSSREANAAIRVALAELSRLREENERLERQVKGYQHHLRACEQIAGKALGYPWFKDDQKNFPGTTEEDGVCIGDHVGDTIVEELATDYAKLRAERDEALEVLRVAETYARTTIDFAIHHGFRKAADQAKADQALIASLITKGGADV